MFEGTLQNHFPAINDIFQLSITFDRKVMLFRNLVFVKVHIELQSLLRKVPYY